MQVWQDRAPCGAHEEAAAVLLMGLCFCKSRSGLLEALLQFLFCRILELLTRADNFGARLLFLGPALAFCLAAPVATPWKEALRFLELLGPVSSELGALHMPHQVLWVKCGV